MFLKFLLRIIQYDDIKYQENSGSIAKMLTLEIPHQSKRLVLQFYKCFNPRLGIMVPEKCTT